MIGLTSAHAPGGCGSRLADGGPSLIVAPFVAVATLAVSLGMSSQLFQHINDVDSASSRPIRAVAASPARAETTILPSIRVMTGPGFRSILIGKTGIERRRPDAGLNGNSTVPPVRRRQT